MSFKNMFLLFLMGTGSSLLAQQKDLIYFIQSAKVNYPSVKSRAAEVSSAASEVNAAALEYIPRVSVAHQYTYGTSNSVAGSFYPNPAVISPAGGIRADHSSPATWGSYTSAILEWNIFNFGKVAATVKASKAGLASTQAAYDNEVFQQQIKVADAYLLELVAARIASIQHVNLERALHFQQAVHAGVRSGLRPGVDSSLAHAEYAKSKILLLESERGRKAQRLRLLELSGVVSSEELSLDSMDFFTSLPSVPDSLAVNPAIHPLLRLYRSRLELANARSTAVRRAAFPSITLVGAAWARGSGVYSEDDSFHTGFTDGTKYQVNNYLLGISARWVVSDLLPIHQRYRSERFKAARDSELYNEQNIKMNRQLKEASMQYEVALEQARTAPVQLESARQAYQQANARYKSGLADLPTMLQSMFALNRAEADMAIAYSNVWRSLLAVAAASGDLSLFMNAIQP